jgi:hypothetical protein
MQFGIPGVLVLLLAASAVAQDRPQLVWEGEVDGVSVLRVHGRRIDIEDREGLPVQRQRFQFAERLPDSRRTVRMEVVEGRGRVRILEQPQPGNNYTLAVSIEDRQGGSSFYSLAFYWDSSSSFFGISEPVLPGPDRGDALTWSGRVDGEAVVNCRANTCEAEVRRGGPVLRDRFRFSRPLPSRNTVVSLEESRGRGDIRLLQQPREENGYTASVLIRDPEGGAGEYSFSLVWQRTGRDRGFEFARRGMVWSGRVDGRARIALEGSRAVTQTLSGAPVLNERADFQRALPARDNPNATIRRLRGRGRVEIVEYPSSRNGYRLVFEIDDSGGGAADYQVEVGW